MWNNLLNLIFFGGKYCTNLFANCQTQAHLDDCTWKLNEYSFKSLYPIRFMQMIRAINALIAKFIGYFDIFVVEVCFKSRKRRVIFCKLKKVMQMRDRNLGLCRANSHFTVCRENYYYYCIELIYLFLRISNKIKNVEIVEFIGKLVTWVRME